MYREVIVIVLSLLLSQMSLAQYIDNVDPGSPYEKIGLKAGDTIISYDNQNVDSPSAAMDLYSKLNSGKIETVTIKRNVSSRKNPDDLLKKPKSEPIVDEKGNVTGWKKADGNNQQMKLGDKWSND